MRPRRTPAAALLLVCVALLAPTPAAAEVVQTPDRTGSHVARLVIASSIRARPGAGMVLQRLDPGRGPASLLVLGERTVGATRYIHVVLSRRGKRDGWVEADHVELTRQPFMVELGRAGRTLRLYRSGRLIMRTRVVVGARATPTPLGLFAVHQTVWNRPSDPLGPATIQLSAFSEVLHEFAGGPGRVAIHGMRGSLVAPLGSAVSHGCIRMRNPQARRLAQLVPAGTPVRIRAV